MDGTDTPGKDWLWVMEIVTQGAFVVVSGRMDAAFPADTPRRRPPQLSFMLLEFQCLQWAGNWVLNIVLFFNFFFLVTCLFYWSKIYVT